MDKGENGIPPNADEMKSARILVIDDEEVVHVSLRRILGRRGHQVETELNAPRALERLREESFDLVITDLMMPEMDGIELLKELKAERITVPVLMITGYPTIRTALQALRLDAVDYLAKPFTRQELLGPVNRALRRVAGGEQEAEKAPVEQTERDGTHRDREKGVDLKPGKKLHLRQHSWAVYQQDGTMKVGIEPSFLASVGVVSTVELPEVEDLVEQGYIGIRLTNTLGESHGVFIPLSGRVLAVNENAVVDPTAIDPATWLIRIVPDHLESELELLVRGS